MPKKRKDSLFVPLKDLVKHLHPAQVVKVNVKWLEELGITLVMSPTQEDLVAELKRNVEARLEGTYDNDIVKLD